MNTQPEALRLAPQLDELYRQDVADGVADVALLLAADELRRLHEVNAELLEVLKQLCAAQEKGHVADWAAVWDDAKAAIAKAEVLK